MFRTSLGVLGFVCFFFKCEQRQDRHLSDRSIVTEGSFRRIAQVEDSDREIEGHFKMCHLWCGYLLVPCELSVPSPLARNLRRLLRSRSCPWSVESSQLNSRAVFTASDGYKFLTLPDGITGAGEDLI